MSHQEELFLSTSMNPIMDIIKQPNFNKKLHMFCLFIKNEVAPYCISSSMADDGSTMITFTFVGRDSATTQLHITTSNYSRHWVFKELNISIDAKFATEDVLITIIRKIISLYFKKSSTANKYKHKDINTHYAIM